MNLVKSLFVFGMKLAKDSALYITASGGENSYQRNKIPELLERDFVELLKVCGEHIRHR